MGRSLRLALVVVASAAFLVGAVSGMGCEAKCSGGTCPDGGSALYQYAPSGLSAPLAAVTSDPPCTAKLVTANGQPVIDVADDTPSGTVICHLHGTLPNGQTATATVTLQQQTGAADCCPSYVGSGGEFALSDGGA